MRCLFSPQCLLSHFSLERLSENNKELGLLKKKNVKQIDGNTALPDFNRAMQQKFEKKNYKNLIVKIGDSQL